MFQDRHVSSYFADPIGLKIGYKDSKKALFETKRLRTLELGELRANKSIVKWEAKALEAEDINSIKAAFISEMLKASTISVSYKDKSYTKLVSASNRYWKYFTYKDLPNAKTEVDFNTLCFYSPPGSLGFYSISTKSTQIENEPLQFIKNLLQTFWLRLNISFSLTARERFELVLNKLDFNYDYLKLAQNQAEIMLNQGNYIFNREGLNTDNLKNLPLKVLLGEVNDCVVSELDALAYYIKSNSTENSLNKLGYSSDFNKKKYLTRLLTRVTQIAAPAGVNLILQAFYIEALYKIALLLEKIEPTLDKKQFLLDLKYEQDRLSIVKYLSLAVDSLEGLSLFSTYDWAQTEKNKIKNLLMYYLSTTSKQVVPVDTEFRLLYFEKELSINKPNDILLLAKDSLDITVQSPVSNKEGEFISLTAVNYIVWGQIELNITYINQTKKNKAINVRLISLNENVTFQSTKITLLTNQVKKITLPVTGVGYGGIVAVVSNSNSDIEITKEEINNIVPRSNTLVFENN